MAKYFSNSLEDFTNVCFQLSCGLDGKYSEYSCNKCCSFWCWRRITLQNYLSFPTKCTCIMFCITVVIYVVVMLLDHACCICQNKKFSNGLKKMSISLPYGAIASAQNGIKMLIHAEISSQSGCWKDIKKAFHALQLIK